tara:strand:+ start:315 stop:593 length:279 start_codon:yes stop_codon:yes gene_type:complete
MVRLKVKDLKEGLNIFKGDLLPTITDSSISVWSLGHDVLNDWKKNTFISVDMDVIIDRSKDFNQIFVPSLDIQRKEYCETKARILKGWGTNS